MLILVNINYMFFLFKSRSDMRNRWLLLTVIIFIISSCNPNSKLDEFKIHIVETTDLHGALLPYDYINHQQSDHSLAQVCTYVNQLRDERDSKVVLLDNGDILQGQPIVYYNNINNVENHVVPRMLNFMKYDAAVVGNHDIEAGHKVYDNLNNQFNFPWLAANALNKETKEPYFKPYTIINRFNQKIAILGLITPGVPKWLPENLWSGIIFEDMVVSAKKWMAIIQTKEKPDVVIGLFHAGHDATYGGVHPEDPCNENASLEVAKEVPGFDVVFIGHDHDVVVKDIVNNIGDTVKIIDPGSSARNVGLATLSFKHNSDNDTYDFTVDASVVPIKDVLPDDDFMTEFKNDHTQIMDYTNQVLGVCNKEIESMPSYYGQSRFMSLIHKVQLKVSGADISFAAPLSYNTKIEKGEIKVSDCFKLYRYDNMLSVIELTGDEIDGYLEYSYANWYSNMTSSNDHLMKFKTDDQGNISYDQDRKAFSLFGNYFNFDSAAGIYYHVDVRKPDGDKVFISKTIDGEKFDENKKYKVVVNSYRANGGGGHFLYGAKINTDSLKQRTVWNSDFDMRFFLMDYIKNNKILRVRNMNNWVVVPSKWRIKGWERDYPLMFSKK